MLHLPLTKISNLQIFVFVEQQIFGLLYFRQIPTVKKEWQMWHFVLVRGEAKKRGNNMHGCQRCL